MNAMPPDPAFRGRRRGATSGWPASRRRRRGCSSGSASSTTGRTGDRARSRPDYDAIEAAILNVGGWMDSYVDAAFRMQAACTRADAGRSSATGSTAGRRRRRPGRTSTSSTSWSASSTAGCKGIPNGADDEPALVLVRARVRGARAVPDAPARAAGGRRPPTRTRPSRRARGGSPAATLPLVGGARRPTPADDGGARHRPLPPPADGRDAGPLSWGAGGPPNGLARDLRPDEALGPTYTSRAAGRAARRSSACPEVVLHLAVSAPVATAVVRLTDVAPDGTSAQVSAGILNLTHRRSHVAPGAARPGRDRGGPHAAPAGRLSVRCRVTGSGCRSRRRPGRSSGRRRIRPSSTLHRGPATPSRLILPVVPPAGGPGDAPVPAFKTSPPDVPAVGARASASDAPVWRIADDVIAGTVTVTIHDGGEDLLDDGRRLYAAETLTHDRLRCRPGRARRSTPTSSTAGTSTTFGTEIRARSRQTSDAAAFDLAVDLEVDLDGERVLPSRVARVDPAPPRLTAPAPIRRRPAPARSSMASRVSACRSAAADPARSPARRSARRSGCR